CLLWSFSASSQPVVPAPAVTGSYTAEQAQRGEALYVRHCAQCHGATLGGVDQSPPLAGPQFASVWNTAPLAALLARIQTMPPEPPGTRPPAGAVDSLPYWLCSTGQPAGNTPLDFARVGQSTVSVQPRDQGTPYGGNLASHRYAALDQINRDNFKDL